MVGLVSVSVPLYRLFCAVTGFGGTTQRVEANTAKPSDRVIAVQFSTSVAPGMPWRFEPEQREVKINLGEDKLVLFSAENPTDAAIVGRATFNVTPLKTGIYFKKIQCFCFNEERLEPHQKVDMPVQFYVDPALATDPSTSDVTTITLSYTFFRATDPLDAKELGRFSANAEPDARRGAELFAERCAACHALGQNKIGPPLGDVFGRRAGSLPGFAYSPALAGSGIDWSASNLDRWLSGPQAFLPGAKMPVRVLDPTARRDLVAYLQQVSPSALRLSEQREK
jgi:cytochrome c oxidase assembly protein Cox11